MCIRTTPARASAASRSRAGSPPSARMSLMIAAPASRARRATSALVVSTEIGAPTRGASASTTGTTRRSSSSAETGSAPGRLDSPPMSSRSAPSSTRRRACATASSRVQARPPSEKLSGVTLTIPMTRGTRSVTIARPWASQRIMVVAPGRWRRIESRPMTDCTLPGVFHHVDDLGGDVLGRAIEGGLGGLADLDGEVDGIADEDGLGVLLGLERRVVGPLGHHLDRRVELAGEVERALDDDVLVGEVDRAFEDRVGLVGGADDLVGGALLDLLDGHLGQFQLDVAAEGERADDGDVDGLDLGVERGADGIAAAGAGGGEGQRQQGEPAEGVAPGRTSAQATHGTDPPYVCRSQCGRSCHPSFARPPTLPSPTRGEG